MAGPVDHRKAGWNGQRPTVRLHVVGDTSTRLERRSIRVLYVEDDEDDVFLLGRHLERMPNFDPDYASTPSLEDARSLLSHERFDVVLCDFWLGRETTIPLIDELSLSPSPCPIVLVSSLDNDDIELIGRRAGAAGFVAKADLSAATLDRVFTTLLPEETERPREAPGLGGWLRALMRGLDRAKAIDVAGGQAPVGEVDLAFSLAELLGPDVDRDRLLADLAGLERATSVAGSRTRFDAVPHVADAVRSLRGRVDREERVAFTAPVFPLLIESSPALFGDLIQAFFAEGADALDRGASVSVRMAIVEGALEIVIEADAPPRPDDKPGRTAAGAAAEARRFLARTLASASGGRLDFGSRSDSDARLGLLTVPLRATA